MLARLSSSRADLRLNLNHERYNFGDAALQLTTLHDHLASVNPYGAGIQTSPEMLSDGASVVALPPI